MGRIVFLLVLFTGCLFDFQTVVATELPPKGLESEEQNTLRLNQQLVNSLNRSDTKAVYDGIRGTMAEAAREGQEGVVFKAHLALSRAAIRFKHYSKALSSLEIAQQMALGRNDWDGLAETYYLKTLVLHRLELHSKGLASARAALEYIDEIKSDSLAMEVALALATVLYTHNELQLAYEASLHGLSRIPPGKPSFARVIFNDYLGSVCNDWGVLLPALTFYQKSLDEAKLLSDSVLISIAYNNIGLLYKTLKRYDLAYKYLDRSLAIDKARNDIQGMAEVYSNMGILFTHMKQFEEARGQFDKSFALVQKLADSSLYSLLYNNYGDLYLEKKNYQKALSYANKAVAIDEKIGNPIELAISLQTRARILTQMGDYAPALTDYGVAEKIFLKNGSTENLASLYSEMADLYHKSGESSKAFVFLSKSIVLNDSVYNQQLLNQSLYITIDRELVEKQEEIDRLKAERTVEMQRLAEKIELVHRKTLFQYALMVAVFVAIAALVMLFRLLRKNKAANLRLRLQNLDMEHQRKQLIEAAEKAREADRLKDNFLASMNHELRTPLNGIIGFAEIIEHESADAVHVEMAKSIAESGSRLMTTLNGLLNLSQIERNMVEVAWSIFSLPDVVSEVVERYRPSALEKKLAFQVMLPSRPVRISSDEVLVARVVENLIDNAIKFTQQGSITLSVKGMETPAGYKAVVDVADTGIGINSDHLETIFHHFRQVSEGLVRDFEGTGVGLSLCRSYLVLLGGDLKVVSTPGEGSTFTLILPALWEEQDRTQAKFQREHNQEADSLNMPRVLLVEDDDINREFAIYTLSGICEVGVATTAQMALDMAKDLVFDAVLLDINLGRGITGLDVLHLLRSMPGYENVPVAAVTANTLKGDRDRLLAGGFNLYLPKPYSRKELIALIDSMLKNFSANR